jgi:hypothetical protein
MMSEKIKAHNEVNGFVFSVVEFAIIALSILPVALYYLLHARLIAFMIATGIAVNALTVVAFGIHALATRQKDIGIMSWFDKKERAAIASRYPHLTRDTLILTTATLLPFVLLLDTVFDLIHAQMRR